MIIKTIPITVFEQNCRILVDSENEAACVIDPGGDIPAVLQSLPKCANSEKRYAVTAVVLTHAHLDHAGGVARLFREIEKSGGSKPRLFGHSREKMLRGTLSQQAMMFGMTPGDFENCPEPDEFLDDGSLFEFGEQRFHVLFTPGHSPGHISLYLPESEVQLQEISRSGLREKKVRAPIVIAGDALFSGGIGRTDLPGGNHQQLIRSIREKLLTLPESTIVLSGHGEDTTIGKEKRSNPFLL